MTRSRPGSWVDVLVVGVCLAAALIGFLVFLVAIAREVLR